MKNALAVAVLAASFTSVCPAQTAAPVPQNLLACSKLQDAAERVRCYDAQIAAMTSATATTPAQGAAPAPSPAAASVAAPAAGTAPRAPASAAASATATRPGTPAPAAASATAAPAGSAPAAAESARAAPVAPGSTGSAAPQSSAVASDRARAAEFGQEELPQASRPPKNKDDESLSSRITALNALGGNKYLISLENGQVWRQKESDHVASFFHVGDDVRIERGMLGSYRLWSVSTGEKNWIAVLRAR